jgi:hypothetical protein
VRRLLLCTLLLACLAAPFAGQSDRWRTYENRGGNFSALMPSEPKETVSGEGDQASHTIQAISGSIGYTVVYVSNSTEQPVDEGTYKVYRDHFFKGLPQCELDREDAVSRPLVGFIGRWYRMNCNVSGQKMTFTGNLYWGRYYAYAALAMYATAPSEPQQAAKFYNSFAVLNSRK